MATWIALLWQVSLMSIDEWVCHRRRDLPNWERWGHPADSLLLALTLLVPAFADFNSLSFGIYVLLSIISSLAITKDEWVHAKECDALEHWIHSLLFINHPVMLFCLGLLWYFKEGVVLRQGIPFAVVGFSFYQVIYWLVIRGNKQHILRNTG